MLRVDCTAPSFFGKGAGITLRDVYILVPKVFPVELIITRSFITDTFGQFSFHFPTHNGGYFIF